jgi:2-polyprenyl-6-methoxyphenol hydroxylase-like FAD-dependent oxidoreductase
VFGAAGDQPLKTLRHDETLTNVVRACPLHAHWLEGQPITSVLAMSGVVDRYRRFVSDGTPVATGFVAVADAWACTNPSAGRGLTVGFLHAARLRDVLRDAPSNPRTLVEAFDEKTEAEITPWYAAQIANDRARFADMEALRDGRQPPQPIDPLASDIRLLFALMGTDPDRFRAGIEYIGTITPAQEILERPQIADAVSAAKEGRLKVPPFKIPGPDREQLLALLS